MHRNTYFSYMCNRGFEHLGFDSYLYFLSCSDWCPLVPRGWIRDGVPRAVPGAGSCMNVCHIFLLDSMFDGHRHHLSTMMVHVPVTGCQKPL